MAAAAAALGNPAANVAAGMGNGCRMKATSSSSVSRENIPSSEFMHGSGSVDNYRGLANPTSSVSTIPMTLNTSAPPQSFRFRIAEYSEERKRSFVRLSRKYRQAQQSQGAQVSFLSYQVNVDSISVLLIAIWLESAAAIHTVCVSM